MPMKMYASLRIDGVPDDSRLILVKFIEMLLQMSSNWETFSIVEFSQNCVLDILNLIHYGRLHSISENIVCYEDQFL